VGTYIRRVRRINAAHRNLSREPDDVGPAEEGAPLAVPDFSELLRHTLRRDLELAAEHVHSIRWLLEIARQHKQRIPISALTARPHEIRRSTAAALPIGSRASIRAASLITWVPTRRQ